MSEQDPEQTGKIVVDEDWKAQAQAEKEQLVEREQETAEEPSRDVELPPASFSILVSQITTQALFAIGAKGDQGKAAANYAVAKYHIDTLAMLSEKTKGHLLKEEQSLLDSALYEIRMAYTNAAQAG